MNSGTQAQIRILPPVGDNYIYLISDGAHAAVVDPSAAEEVRKALQEVNLQLSAILLTHHHGDHVAGCGQLLKLSDCAVYGPDDRRVQSITHPLSDGDNIQVAGVELKVLGVPGHTRTHLAYHAPGLQAVWTGDCVFVAGCGRIIEGSAEQMHRSVNRIAELPPDTRLYCGHDYTLENLEFAHHICPRNPAIADKLRRVRKLARSPEPTVPSTIAEERETNLFMRTNESETREGLALAADTTPVEVFARLRALKDRW